MGVECYASCGSLKECEGIRTKATQLLTNMSLAYHMLDQQEQALQSADHVLEHLDENNYKALMRRAYALRTQFRFTEALKDLSKLKKMMDPSDNALKEVNKMYKSCWLGINQQSEKLPETSVRRMSRDTGSWITGYRELRDTKSKIAYLRPKDGKKLSSVFDRISVPREIFADIVVCIEETSLSLFDLKWVTLFLKDVAQTYEFDSQVLAQCQEVSNIKLEILSRKMTKANDEMGRQFKSNWVNQQQNDDTQDDASDATFTSAC